MCMHRFCKVYIPYRNKAKSLAYLFLRKYLKSSLAILIMNSDMVYILYRIP